jgi:hypothetical protein
MRGTRARSLDIVLYTGVNFTGQAFAHPSTLTNLDPRIDSKAKSLRVSHTGWITFYSYSHFRGSEFYLNGPRDMPDLSRKRKRNIGGFDGDWNEEISSFQEQATKPLGGYPDQYEPEDPTSAPPPAMETRNGYLLSETVVGNITYYSFYVYDQGCTHTLATVEKRKVTKLNFNGLMCQNFDVFSITYHIP